MFHKHQNQRSIPSILLTLSLLVLSNTCSSFAQTTDSIKTGDTNRTAPTTMAKNNFTDPSDTRNAATRSRSTTTTQSLSSFVPHEECQRHYSSRRNPDEGSAVDCLGANIRAHTVEDIAKPATLAVLNHRVSNAQKSMKDLTDEEAKVLFATNSGEEASLSDDDTFVVSDVIMKLISQGKKTSNEFMEELEVTYGLSEDEVKSLLKKESVTRQNEIIQLMEALAQEELVSTLSNVNEEYVEEHEDSMDALGNIVVNREVFDDNGNEDDNTRHLLASDHGISHDEKQSNKITELTIERATAADTPCGVGAVALRSFHGTYIRAHPGGEGAKVDQQTYIGGLEQFRIVSVPNQARKYALKTAHGNYIRTFPGGEGAGVNQQTFIGPWEQFSIVSVPNQAGKYALKTAHGTYLRAHPGGEGAKVDLQTYIGGWEQFTIVSLGKKCQDSCSAKQIERANPPQNGRTGPGFRIRNDTKWPVEFSLWQVGPLYWELVQPGQYFYRETGAVWFTVKAEIRFDNKPKISVWDAIWPIGSIIASVASAIVTFGSSAALSASVAAGGAAGSVSASVVAAVASTLVGMGFKAGTALYITTAAVGATKAIIKAGGVYLGVKAAVFDDLGFIEEGMVAASRAGVYAGYPWPFEQKTQTIRLTGGPDIYPSRDVNTKECLNVMDKTSSKNLKFTCESGGCWI